LIGLAELQQRTWRDCVAALDEAWLCRIPLRLLKEDALSSRLAALTSARLRDQYDFQGFWGHANREQRVAAVLLTASVRLYPPGHHGGPFKLPITNKDMGSYLGLRPESVSRALGRLEADGWIERRGRRITLNDAGGMRRFADESRRAQL